MWCNTPPYVYWEDPQSPLLFGDLPINTGTIGDTHITITPHTQVHLTGNSSVGKGKTANDNVDGGVYTIWRVLINDVVKPGNVPPTAPTGVQTIRSLRNGANASHKFGHMITSPHSKRVANKPMDIMYHNASTYGAKNGNSKGATHCLSSGSLN